MSDVFWRLMERSVIISGTIATLMVVTACYIWATGGNVPDELYQLLILVVSFFFGAKVGSGGAQSQSVRSEVPDNSSGIL